jgi:hypothetical protein
MLLFRLLAGARLGEREALGLFAAGGAFFYVVSALAVSHKTFTLTLSRPVPSDFAESGQGFHRCGEVSRRSALRIGKLGAEGLQFALARLKSIRDRLLFPRNHDDE